MLPALLLATTVAASAPAPGPGWVEGMLQARDSVILLEGAQAGCPDGEKVADFLKEGEVTKGCWFKRDDTVWIWWFDGDRSAVPAKAFKAPPAL